MTNFSNNYFGKNLEELDYSDITAFFNAEKEESDKIEFKAYHPQFGNLGKNLEGVIRGICAFLNSSGGLLIWGAPLAKKLHDITIFQGNLSPVSELLEKDSLISRISDSITPLPINININILEQDKNYIYVFEVQQSNYSPHQFKNTYWARLDGQTKPAPHYLIEALFKKITYPNIEGYINLEKFGSYDHKRSYLDISIIIINFSELQNEYDVSYRVLCPQAQFEGSLKPSLSPNYQMQGHEFINNGHIKILHFGSPDKLSQKLVFDLEEIQEKNQSEIDIVLIFGGKNSPLKFSEYKLNFSLGTISGSNPAELLSYKLENITAAEKQKKLGTTRENLLKTILKR